MERTEKMNQILNNLEIQNSFFNPLKSPGKDREIQFVFNESEGVFSYYFTIRNKVSTITEGIAVKPVFKIITGFKTWEQIGGGYLSAGKAIRNGVLKIEGNFLFFLLRFRKIYSGNTFWKFPSNLYHGAYNITEIKKVLVLSCSPRGSKGATHLMVEHLVKGIKKAGAEVEILFPSKMKINTCVGCFKCWVNDTRECIYHDSDDMKIILEKYHESDLIVWATPVYHYHGTTAMKTVMDRLFINSDPHFVEEDGAYRHPRKWEHIPSYAVLAVGGFPDMDIFKSLQDTFKILSSHTGIKIIGELFRHTSMMFLSNNMKMKKKEEVLSAFETAGSELIQHQKISGKTKRAVEQKMMEVPMIMSAVNHTMDIMQSSGDFPFIRKAQ